MVLYLDPYFLGDPLFLAGFARDLAARPAGLVVVHGSGERGERALESLGRMPQRRDGVWETDDDAGAEAVERATRELNRELVHELNEAGVAAIRATGADRGLLTPDSSGVTVGRAGWVGELVGQGVVVVVAALVDGGAAGREVDAAAAAGALAAALDVPLAVLTTRSTDGGALADAVPDADAVRRTGAARVRAGLRATLRRPDGPSAEHAVV